MEGAAIGAGKIEPASIEADEDDDGEDDDDDDDGGDAMEDGERTPMAPAGDVLLRGASGGVPPLPVDEGRKPRDLLEGLR